MSDICFVMKTALFGKLFVVCFFNVWQNSRHTSVTCLLFCCVVIVYIWALVVEWNVWLWLWSVHWQSFWSFLLAVHSYAGGFFMHLCRSQSFVSIGPKILSPSVQISIGPKILSPSVKEIAKRVCDCECSSNFDLHQQRWKLWPHEALSVTLVSLEVPVFWVMFFLSDGIFPVRWHRFQVLPACYLSSCWCHSFVLHKCQENGSELVQNTTPGWIKLIKAGGAKVPEEKPKWVVRHAFCLFIWLSLTMDVKLKAKQFGSFLAILPPPGHRQDFWNLAAPPPPTPSWTARDPHRHAGVVQWNFTTPPPPPNSLIPTGMFALIWPSWLAGC